jgi:hypothetical protein
MSDDTEYNHKFCTLVTIQPFSYVYNTVHI